jgi:hypothetical protein
VTEQGHDQEINQKEREFSRTNQESVTLRLGLKAPALAWLHLALASQISEPGQKPKVGLGPAWLWPKPRLLVQKRKNTVKSLKKIKYIQIN